LRLRLHRCTQRIFFRGQLIWTTSRFYQTWKMLKRLKRRRNKAHMHMPCVLILTALHNTSIHLRLTYSLIYSGNLFSARACQFILFACLVNLWVWYCTMVSGNYNCTKCCCFFSVNNRLSAWNNYSKNCVMFNTDSVCLLALLWVKENRI